MKQAQNSDESLWDDYVNQHPDATFFHLFGWKKALEMTVKHKNYYLYALNGETIVGVLPLGHIKSLLFGNTLVSTPFAVYGGILADNDEVKSLLRQAACDLAEKLKVDHLELRNLKRENPDWPTKELYVYFKKELADNDDDNLKAIPRKQRAMVRKGIKADLSVEVNQNIEPFFQAYSESVRNLGTPVFPKKLFQSLLTVFSDKLDILTITKEDTLVASVMNFYFRDTVLPYYGGGTSSARFLKGNDFMYWSLMQHAAKKEIKYFDYGRSKEGTGSYSFKKNWGFEPQPLYYEYYLVTAKEISEINPLNPKYQIFIKLWRKLPLKLSQILGPIFSRDLG
ncbi:MAG: FemAB family PEP-CTERM system-associated protein [Gammaproteobacteria bacterium]|nr:FemAB family PEP-CTERM system-associated protein [Gammaproteobacteria bacterium]